MFPTWGAEAEVLMFPGLGHIHITVCKRLPCVIHSFILFHLSSRPTLVHPSRTCPTGSQSDPFDVLLFIFVPAKHVLCACVFLFTGTVRCCGLHPVCFLRGAVILTNTRAVVSASRTARRCALVWVHHSLPRRLCRGRPLQGLSLLPA